MQLRTPSATHLSVRNACGERHHQGVCPTSDMASIPLVPTPVVMLQEGQQAAVAVQQPLPLLGRQPVCRAACAASTARLRPLPL